jgi:subtilisin family serine protease
MKCFISFSCDVFCDAGDAQNFNVYRAVGGNLTGLSQVVGVADTGLDLTSCYLHDPNNSTVPRNAVNLRHRKVVAYMYASSGSKMTDVYDDNEGHGTHVANSLAGLSLSVCV